MEFVTLSDNPDFLFVVQQNRSGSESRTRTDSNYDPRQGPRDQNTEPETREGQNWKG